MTDPIDKAAEAASDTIPDDVLRLALAAAYRAVHGHAASDVLALVRQHQRHPHSWPTAVAAAEAVWRHMRADRDAAILALSRASQAQGLAEGKLAASEMAGVVEGWRERALKAEAAAIESAVGSHRLAALERIAQLVGVKPEGDEVAWINRTVMWVATAAGRLGMAVDAVDAGDG